MQESLGERPQLGLSKIHSPERNVEVNEKSEQKGSKNSTFTLSSGESTVCIETKFLYFL